MVVSMVHWKEAVPLLWTSEGDCRGVGHVGVSLTILFKITTQPSMLADKPTMAPAMTHDRHTYAVEAGTGSGEKDSVDWLSWFHGKKRRAAQISYLADAGYWAG